jgi:hypothetical protein
MDTNELQQRVDASAELSAFRDQLGAALAAKAENRYAFDPFTIIMIISVIIQVIQFCRAKRSPEEIAADMQNVRNLPPRKLMRFKRRSNVLWKQYCAQHGLDTNTPNPIPDAAYALGETTSRGAIDALIGLSG